MKYIRISAAVLARFFISAVFLAGSVNIILNWHEMEKHLMNTLCDWQTYLGFSETVQSCFAWLTPWTPLLLIAATLFELIGGLLVLLGIREKLGAVLLVLFLIPSMFIMHQFWFVEDPAVLEVQRALFLNDLAILGGLFLILLNGGAAKGGGGDPFPPMRMG